jgi:flagellar biogenesis protein FliO
MSQNRYQSPKKRPRARDSLILGVSPAFWFGSLLVALALLLAIYWLLMRPATVVGSLGF